MRKIVGIVKMENGNVRLMYEDGKSYVTLQSSAKLTITQNNKAVQVRQQNAAHEYIVKEDLQYLQVLPNAATPFDQQANCIYQLKEILEQYYFFNLGGVAGTPNFGLKNPVYLPSYHRFYCADVKAATSADIVIANNLYAYEFIVPSPITISQIGCTIISTAIGNKARIGVYSDFNCNPDDVLVDVEIDLGVSGVQFVNFPAIDLEPGMYWYSFLAQASVTWRTIQPDWQYPAVLGTTGLISGSGYTRLGRAFAYQPNLPANFGSGNNRLVTNNPIFNLYCS